MSHSTFAKIVLHGSINEGEWLLREGVTAALVRYIQNFVVFYCIMVMIPIDGCIKVVDPICRYP